MGEPFLVEITGEESNLKKVSCLGRILVSTKKLNDSLSLLQRFETCIVYVNAVSFETRECITLLDNGAAKIFVTLAQFKEIVNSQLLEDLKRLVVSAESSNGNPEELNTAHDFDGVDVSFSHAAMHASSRRKSYIRLAENSTEALRSSLQKDHIPIVPAAYFTTESSAILPETLITTCLQTDRSDGLYTTVVVDERGICLGLVYSSEASLRASLETSRGVYQSRKRGLWRKGESSGDIQELVRIGVDCDGDALLFTVRQKGDGFCHLKTATCFGPYFGLSKLEKTLTARKTSAPEGSYTARLFGDSRLLQAKIMEEASELCEAESKEHVASEAADLLYFALTKCVAAGVGLDDVERNLDLKSLKTTRRRGDAKPQWTEQSGSTTSKSDIGAMNGTLDGGQSKETIKEAASIPKSKDDTAGIRNDQIQMKRFVTSSASPEAINEALERPSQRSTDEIMAIVKPIIDKVRCGGDAAVLEYTHKFEKATSLQTSVLEAPFPAELMNIAPETKRAMDTSFDNIRKFHAAQQESKPLQVETMPGVVCSRFSRPIESVGLYVPGGTAVLPSTALMLGVPAMVAGCKNIVFACPPRSDGTFTPEVVYAAHRVGAKSIVLAGGAQAIAAMAYGTESITKADKILGPGNQFVTAAKMLVSNDTMARVAIDMPAGPSEVLVVADKTANPVFVASDLLSQAEHGVDSQVVLIAIALEETQLQAIEAELHKQANALPRVDIVRGAINHSVTLVVADLAEAMALSNRYAPEHLILQIERAEEAVGLVTNAGSVFVGPWTPESVGDYSAGVNHSLPTYGYARQYSGVSLASFTKHITSSELTREGLRNVGGAVMALAEVEGLQAHKRAVSLRLEYLDGEEGRG